MKKTITLGIILGLMTILSTAAIASCPDNMVSYWKFDDGTATDTAGNNDGTIYGATQTTGKLDDALDFDGSDDYVKVSDDNSLSFVDGSGDTPLSFCAWLKRDNTTKHTPIFGKSKYGDSEYIFSVMSDNSLQFILYGDGDGSEKTRKLADPSTAYNNNWAYVCATYDGSEDSSGIKLYIDGVLQPVNSTEDSSISMSNLGDPAYIGAYNINNSPWDSYTDGTIDEVAIYDKALNSTEIKELYEASANKGKGYCNVEPTATNFSGTNLSKVEDLTNVSNLELQEESSGSKIKWNNSVNVVAENLDKNVKIDPSFVSLNASSMDSTFNSSANVTVNVASCDNWDIYYSNKPVSSLSELKTEGSKVGTGAGSSGSCTSYCHNPTCSNGVLTYRVDHFDSTGGEGTEDTGTTIPEFNFAGMILIIAIAGIALYFISNRKR